MKEGLIFWQHLTLDTHDEGVSRNSEASRAFFGIDPRLCRRIIQLKDDCKSVNPDSIKPLSLSRLAKCRTRYSLSLNDAFPLSDATRELPCSLLLTKSNLGSKSR